LSLEKREWETSFDELVERRGHEFMLYRPKHYINISAFLQPPSSILDVGCGISRLKRFLHPLSKYVGVDITEELLEEGRRQNPGIDVRHASALDIPFRPRSFDYVVCKDLLEHMKYEEVPDAIKEMARVAKYRLIISFFKSPGKRSRVLHGTHAHFSNRYGVKDVKQWIDDIGREYILTVTKIDKMQELWQIIFLDYIEVIKK
jgi:ubiquinone/menaquinone biosynthesis C-methylase UbiE